MAKSTPNTTLLSAPIMNSSDLSTGQHRGHKLTHVGPFKDVEGNVYEVYYCENDHRLVVF